MTIKIVDGWMGEQELRQCKPSRPEPLYDGANKEYYKRVYYACPPAK